MHARSVVVRAEGRRVALGVGIEGGFPFWAML